MASPTPVSGMTQVLDRMVFNAREEVFALRLGYWRVERGSAQSEVEDEEERE